MIYSETYIPNQHSSCMSVYNIEDCLDEFDVRYMEACNQVSSLTSLYEPPLVPANVIATDSLSSKTGQLTLSSPLLGHKELDFTCYQEKRGTTSLLDGVVAFPPCSTNIY